MSAPDTTAPLTLTDLWTILLRRRRTAVVAAVITMLAVLIAPGLLMPPLYRAEAALSAGGGPKPVDFPTDPTANSASEQFLNTQRELLTSRAVLQDALELGGFARNASYARAADRLALLQQRLSTAVIRNSWVISVSLKDEDPGLAESGLQAVLDAYLSRQNTAARKRSEDDLAFLARQVEESAARLDAAREAERHFRSAQAISSVDPDRNHITERIERLAGKQAELDDRIAASDALVNLMRAADAIEDPKQRQAALLRIDNISKFTVIGSLQSDLFQLEGMEAELATQYLDKHPRMIEVRSHLAAKRQQLADVIDAARSGIDAENKALREQRDALVGTMTRLHQDLGAYRESLVGLQRLETETLRLQKFHEELVAKQAQSAVRSAYDDRRLVIDSPPRSSPVPGAPSRIALALLAVVGALVAATTCAFLVDALDPRLADAAAVQRATGLPALGGILHLESGGTPGLASDPRLAEDVRTVLAALRFRLASDATGKTLLLLSAEAASGRTALAGWLAEGLAIAGSSTVLVDGDLRQPDLTARWGAANRPGLAEILAGQAGVTPIETATPNLLICPSGSCAAHPGELLNSPCLGEWLTHCRQHHEAVVIDTPPLASCSDAAVIGQYADAIILVVRSGSSTAAGLRAAMRQLDPLRHRIVGFVLNDAEPRPDGETLRLG